MSSTMTYEQLHTQSLLTINFSLLTQNFKTIDKFIKDFSNFQRKFIDLQKNQKATSQQLTNFKISTQNTFTTINQVVQSRSGLTSKGSINLSDNQQIKQIKKSFQQIKKFITQNTRDQHQSQKIRDQQNMQSKAQLDKKLTIFNQQIQNNNIRAKSIQVQIRQLKLKLATKNQLQSTKTQLIQTDKRLAQTAGQLNQIQNMLARLKVSQFKQSIDKFKDNMSAQFNQLKTKVKLKTDISDTIKLYYDNLMRKLADKNQTKKALIFLEKRMNKLLQTLYGQEEGDKEALLAAKGWKCVSCTKDLGEFQGKLDKYKPWSIFPAKQSPVKDRYSGFGAGFQSILQEKVSKKGVQVSYDQKGRMTTPFNLTRQVQTNLFKAQSQSKITKDSTGFKQTKGSPNKPIQMETNFMNLYGKNNDIDIDIKEQYTKKYNGLLSYIKLSYVENKHETQ